MNKVLIIGANGKVGRKLTQKVKESSDWEGVALIRKEEQKSYFDDMGVEARVASLEDEKSELAEKMKGIDAVVFTAGSGGGTGPDKTLSVDLDGAVKAMEASRDNNIKRFVMVSALNTGNRKAWASSKIKPYYIAKYYADEWLKNSGLDYTILRPGRLMDEPGSGKIDTENPGQREGVPREDVASVALEALKNDNLRNKIIEFNSGETPIDQALKV